MQIKRVHDLTPTELETITNIHSRVLNDSFLNNFGKKFIKLSYKIISKNQDDIFFVVKNNSIIIGFLVATKTGRLFSNRQFLQNFWSLNKEIIFSALKNPSLIFELLSWFLIKLKITDKTPELQFLAISPKYQRKGLGTKLLKKLMEEFKKSDIKYFIVGTKAKNNISNEFYLRNNFNFAYSQKFFGDKFNYYNSPNFSPSKDSNISAKYLGFTVIIFFLVLFIIRSNITMFTVPFYDFDEAHRAENAKQMKLNQSYFVPLTGSSFDRVETLKIPFQNNPILHLYYHLERPFLVYLSMIISTTVFGTTLGSVEWAYRLPSFIFGISSIFCLIYFAKKLTKISFKETSTIIALSTALLALITSSDLWLSSQYAQMDTGITLFLFIGLLSLILYCDSRKISHLALSGISFSLGILSKGQPSIIIIFPIIYLLVIKKLTFKEMFKLIGFSSILLVPWIIYLSIKFGLNNLVSVFYGFAIYSSSIIYQFNVAPFFWYGRWWLESLRPGWTIFLALVLLDIYRREVDWKKGTLLTYIFGGLLAFSIPANKIWWYVLPLIPSVALYIYLSLLNYLKNESERLINLSLAIFIASLPIFLQATNTVSLVYGFITTIIVFILLNFKLNPENKSESSMSYFPYIFTIVLIFSLTSFYQRFPSIVPWHWNTKPVATYYKNLPGQNCLWVYDMPAESVLFYSDAGEVDVYNQDTKLYGHCKHYLITPSEFHHGKLIFKKGHMQLFEL